MWQLDVLASAICAGRHALCNDVSCFRSVRRCTESRTDEIFVFAEQLIERNHPELMIPLMFC
jgi:hypothetical protein